MHCSCADLGLGLQEEMRTSHGPRAAATTTRRILEARSTPLSTTCQMCVVGQDLDGVQPTISPGGRKHLSSNFNPPLTLVLSLPGPGGDGDWEKARPWVGTSPEWRGPDWSALPADSGTHASASICIMLPQGTPVPLWHPQPPSPRFSEAQLPSYVGTGSLRGPMPSF